MAIARSKLVDVSVARWYHCVSRCVRKAFLLGEEDGNRTMWIENRLEALSEVFAVAVGGFSLMDNHLHVLLRLDPAVARTWSDDEVVRRWGRLFPPRDKSRQPIPLPEQWIQERLDDAQWIAKTRERLQSLSWFMKCLKEPLSRLANRQDKTRGASKAWRSSMTNRCSNLVEYTGRLFRQGKASISEELAGIFERLGSCAQNWQTGMERLCGDRLLDRFIAASAMKLREIAERLGVRRLVNLVGCPIR
jgi:hypothetical protein